MKINLMDPGLIRQAGHHFDWAINITRQLVEKGHSVHVYANKVLPEAPRKALAELAPVSPIFSTHPYVGPKEARRVDPIAGEYYLYRQQSQATAIEINQTGDADLQLWPTAFAYQLNACAASKHNTPVSCCIHYPPNARGFKTGAMWWRDAFLNMSRSKKPLRCGTYLPALRNHYVPLTANGKVIVYPVPHLGRPIEAARV